MNMYVKKVTLHIIAVPHLVELVLSLVRLGT